MYNMDIWIDDIIWMNEWMDNVKYNMDEWMIWNITLAILCSQEFKFWITFVEIEKN
jgi:hypothetical protein